MRKYVEDIRALPLAEPAIDGMLGNNIASLLEDARIDFRNGHRNNPMSRE